ncbi:MAG TPA: S41 family peptidase [Longimicrobiales bacterium]|nr:S41 family peptidase [Longimicrobiales bacterium]
MPGPAEVFDSLWIAFDRGYALLADKNVPWKSIGGAHRPLALRSETDEELFEVLSGMLRALNDNHVKLSGWDRFLSNAGHLQGARLDDFSLDVVRRHYLAGPPEQRVDGVVTFGWLADSVGYVHVSAMDDERATATAMDEVVATFAGARGVVVDVRGNLGGDDPVARAIASRFTDRPRPYMMTRFKSGPGREDFTDPVRWNVTPPSTGAYVGPVAVLVQRYTMSAAEGFVLAMRTLPHVVVVGGATAGAFGDVVNDALPNGWHYRTVRARTLDAEGRTWEGIGIPPDVHAKNRPEEIERGVDRVLELGIRLVRAGGFDEPGGRAGGSGAAPALRLPLADSLAAWIDGAGLDAGMGRFRSARADAARWFLAEDPAYGEDLVGLGERLLEAGRAEAAVAVLEAAAEAHPGSYRPWHRLARAYERAGRSEEAFAARRRGLELDPLLYPEDREAAIEMRGLLPLAHRFARDAFRLGVEPAIERLRVAHAADPERAHVDPLVLLRVGYQFREARRLDAARRVFELHVEEFPDDARGPLGLAETFRMMEREGDALSAYRRALRIDPGNRRARGMVERLGAGKPGTTSEEASVSRPGSYRGGWTGRVDDGSTRTSLRLCLRGDDAPDPPSTVDLPGFGVYDLPARVEGRGDDASVHFSLREDAIRLSLHTSGDATVGRWEGAGAEGEIRLLRSRECGPRYRAIPIDFGDGGHRLAGTLLLPRARSGPYPAVVWTHGSGHVDRSDPTYRGLAVALTELGVASLIYDKRGVGESTGDYRTASMRELAGDAVAGVERLASHPEVDAGLIGVGGISQGGWISPAAAVLSPSVRFVVGLSAPGVSPAEQNLFNQHNKLVDAGVSEEIVQRADSLLSEIYGYYRTGEGRAGIEAALRSLEHEPWFETAHELAYWRRRGLEPLSHAYMEDLFFDPEGVWAGVTVPSILVWGEEDALVPARTSESVVAGALERAGNRHRNLMIFPRTDHSLRLPPREPWPRGLLHPGYRAVADFILALGR